MSIKLFYTPQTRAVRPRWILEEMSVPYELERLNLKEKAHKSESYLKIHPLGVVPAMTINEMTLIESLAMCVYLADTYSIGKLAPNLADGKRAKYIQWFFYATNSIEPHLVSYFVEMRKADADKNQMNMDKAAEQFNNGAKILENLLKKNQYLLGNDFSAADVAIGSMLIWAQAMKLLGSFPSLVQYVGRLKERPAYKKATID